MSPVNPSDSRDVLRTLWAADTNSQRELNTECSPTKTCRNMKDINFDGYAENGEDIKLAWKETLKREGKLGDTTLGELLNQEH